MNATLRENILFGKAYDDELYKGNNVDIWFHSIIYVLCYLFVETVEACALVPDFKMLVDGDMTSIGKYFS
jgi:hypothetical protein